MNKKYLHHMAIADIKKVKVKLATVTEGDPKATRRLPFQ